jgi:hypothetical protein
VLLFTLLLVPAADEAAAALAKRMLPVYVREAEAYKIAVASAPDRPLELKKEPVFEWSNPVRSGNQQGVVFLWLRDGRPAAIGSIFSEPEGRHKGRKVIHEFHALAPEKLVVTRPPGALNQWEPQAGLERKELADAPAPAATPAARLLQMRQLAQEFSGDSVDNKGQHWDLRLLPAPLYRYPAAKAGVVDGALFTFVSTAGTDPEVLLLVEAKEDGGKLRWQFACGRFSDRSLSVKRKDTEVWSAVRDEANTFLHDRLHLYRTFADKVVDLDGKLLARVRTTEKVWWGEFLPVTDK